MFEYEEATADRRARVVFRAVTQRAPPPVYGGKRKPRKRGQTHRPGRGSTFRQNAGASATPGVSDFGDFERFRGRVEQDDLTGRESPAHVPERVADAAAEIQNPLRVALRAHQRIGNILDLVAVEVFRRFAAETNTRGVLSIYSSAKRSNSASSICRSRYHARGGASSTASRRCGAARDLIDDEERALL